MRTHRRTKQSYFTRVHTRFNVHGHTDTGSHGHASTSRPGGSPREPTGRLASVKYRSRRAAGSKDAPRATSFAKAPSESRGCRRRSIGPQRHSCTVAPAEPAWSVQLARSSASVVSISPSSAVVRSSRASTLSRWVDAPDTCCSEGRDRVRVFGLESGLGRED